MTTERLAALLHDIDHGECANPGDVDALDACWKRAAVLISAGVTLDADGEPQYVPQPLTVNPPSSEKKGNPPR